MSADDKLVGVIGGMGPEATVDFMSSVLANTPATTDQDHIRMLVAHDPVIPSRQSAIRGEGENPGPVMAAIAAKLEQSGADFIVMPCNLAHAWQDDIVAAITIPFVSIIDVSVSSALQRSGPDSPVGLMTTPGCFAAGLYQQALAEVARPVIQQTPDELGEAMQWVGRIKAGDKSEEVVSGLRALADALIARGARVLIAACTEFPLVLNESMFDVAFVSSTDELAKLTVASARAERDD
ncbi:MAG: amino acid racemase [Gammaproteobacteria bacterium]|nr:amino acid racemase [Gammaproteobacteria bacterium]